MSKTFIESYFQKNSSCLNTEKKNSKKFLKKVLKTKYVFKNLKNNYENYPNIHKVISIIKSWDKRIKIFISPKLFILFKKINKNILRNIFLSKVKDNKVWGEIEKMIDLNILGISPLHVYNPINLSNNLSTFLLNLYLSQLDIYLKKLCYSSNFNKFLGFKPYFLDLFYKRSLNVIKSYIPLKISKYLKTSSALKKIRILKQIKLSVLYKKNSYNLNFSFFLKHIYYIRYNENIALGIIGSKNFSKFIMRKLQGFIRSNLHLDFLEYNFQYSFSESMFFLGFKIQLFNFTSQNTNLNSTLKVNKKYFSRIYARLLAWKKKLSSLTFNRFSSEFFSQVLSVIHNKNLDFSSLKDRRVWLCLFQLEAIRCFQTGKLINSNDKLNLISEYSLKKLKFLNVSSYKNFSFNFYVKKIRIVLKDVLNSFPCFIDKSISPLDEELLVFISEYKKRLSFFNDTFYSILLTPNYLKKNLINNVLNAKTFNNYQTVKKHFFIKTLFFSVSSKNVQLNSYFIINCPISYLLLKFSELGFIDLKKKRPISNIKFLIYEDIEIIKLFGAFSYSMINWFRCSDNFFKVKFLVEIIRQSCFLTLCRKHNKRKTWAYSVYTPNLIVKSTIYDNKSFFPTKKVLFNLKKLFLYNQMDFLYSDNFF